MAQINVTAAWTTLPNLGTNPGKEEFADQAFEAFDTPYLAGLVVGFQDRVDGGVTATVDMTLNVAGFAAATQAVLSLARVGRLTRPDSIEIMTEAEAQRRFESEE